MNKGTTNKLNEIVNENKIFKIFSKGIVVAFLTTFILFIIFSVLLTYTDFSERYISSVVIISTIISILIASSIVTRNQKNNGWLNGGILGFIYIIILYIINGIIYKKFTLNSQIAIMSFIGIITGIIGGIIGINIKKNKRNKKY